MWNNEKQRLLEERSRSLKNAEKRVEELSQRNLVLESDYMKTTNNNTKMRKLISEIIKVAYSNVQDDNMRMRKIKELVADFQANN